MVYLNDGSGMFSDSGQLLGSLPLGTASDNYSVALGDVDGDGNLDAFVGVNGPNRVWINDAGIIGTIVNDDFNTPPAAATDVDGDANDVAEGAIDGTTVGITAEANDAEDDTLVYSLTNDADGRFVIDSGSGVVTVAVGGEFTAELRRCHQPSDHGAGQRSRR